jgi:hypothetical protein
MMVMQIAQQYAHFRAPPCYPCGRPAPGAGLDLPPCGSPPAWESGASRRFDASAAAVGRHRRRPPPGHPFFNFGNDEALFCRPGGAIMRLD